MSRAEASPQDTPPFRAFLVHAYADMRRDRLYFTGRLEDGRSFAAMEAAWRPGFHVYEGDLARCGSLLASVPYDVEPAQLESFSGKEKLAFIHFSRYGARIAALNLLEQAGIPSPDGDIKPAEAFLIQRCIRGPVEIRGSFRPGRSVDVVFPDPLMSPPDQAGTPVRAALKIASIDIETDTKDNSIRAIGISLADSEFASMSGIVRVRVPPGYSVTDSSEVLFHADERSLLAAFINDIQTMDPDVLTGWNFLDFDFPRLAERCERMGVPFVIGRSRDGAKFFAGEGRRSAAAMVPGRQVIDALRVVRSGPKGIGIGWFSDYTLETVAQTILGEGKSVTSSGEDKIAELDRLYSADAVAFGQYCYRDAELVLRIYAKTGLFRLTMERAALTGVFLDKAWTSVVSFERIYGMELRRMGIAPALSLSAGSTVSGAAGGTVLDPLPGLFNNVAVFDFRSLYPTIMRTFNIDPLAHERTGDGPPIEAPNGAAFSRTPGVLPRLITDYFAARRQALDAGDDTAAHVYKILMNSFYGVLGTGACRYGRTELAGAITSFARKWLLLSRDWFTERGYRVLYGDTDSLFVETGLGDDAVYDDFLDRCSVLAADLNRFLGERIQQEYQLESSLELRFEKAYRRFMIPPLRSFHDEGESRGRAKGYGGYLLCDDGTVSVEVKGMEAVRSDATPIARRLQLELLELVFAAGISSGSTNSTVGITDGTTDGGEAALTEKVFDLIKQLRAGKRDDELVYRKRLSRPPETYTASTPPQVKAARLLGWKGRRGTVAFVWTKNGPEPVSLPHAPLDYDHYIDSQILPVVRSIAAAAGWKADVFLPSWLPPENGQMELGL